MVRFSSIPRISTVMGALAFALLLACGPQAAAATYASSSPIAINDLAAGTPYPAQITVGALDGQKIAKVRVTLSNITHPYLADVDVLLVGPGGQSVVLMSDCGGGSASGATLAFDDDAFAVLGPAVPISGSYTPTDRMGFTDVIPSPAPARPYGSTLSAFVDTDPNGVWSLYVVDDLYGDSGSIAGGWQLDITTTTTFGSGFAIADLATSSSTMFITGRHGEVETVTANIVVSHTFPDDLDVLLVAPSGESVVLMSDVGGSGDLSAAALAFADAASDALPDDGPIVAGTFKPTDVGASETYPVSGPYGSAMSALAGAAPNGTWTLYVLDDTSVDTGSIASWSLTITTKQSNDDFAAALPLAAPLPAGAFGSTVGATLEPGEPTHAGDAPHSVWWTWTPASTVPVLIETHDSVGDTALTVFTGSAVGALTEVAYNDNTDSTDATSQVQLVANAGTVYRISTNGRSTSSGDVYLRVRALTAPAITNTSQTFSTNVALSWGILASEFPTSYSVSGLPPGLVLDTATGDVTGTPTTAGVYSVGLGATNAAGTGTSTVTLTINSKPVLVPNTSVVSTIVNAPFSFAIHVANPATGFTAAPLPAGLNLNTTSGVISGTPTAAGSTFISLSATNASGTSTGGLQLYVNPSTAPVVTSASAVAGVVGAPFSFTIAATNSPTMLNLTTRPGWMTINTTTGVASGVPDAPGIISTFAVASNADGTGSKPLTITIVAPGSGGTGGAAHRSSSKGCGLGMNAAALLMLLGWAARRRHASDRG
jgi:subtilisin-like proprotein convertase family protein